MSAQRHTITKLTIELHLPSRDEAWELQNEVSAEYRRLVLEELERIFDSMIEPNEMVIVNRLEIDAGEVEQISELPQALKASAEEAISQLLYNARQDPHGNAEVRITGENGEQLVTEVQIRHRSTTDAGRLSHFLHYGVLPSGTANETVREIALRLLEQEPDVLRNLLKQLRSFRRLVEQFSDDLLLRLLRVFLPDAEERIAISLRLRELLPEVTAKQWWEAAFRFEETGTAFTKRVLSELTPPQKNELRTQLKASLAPATEDKELETALQALPGDDVVPEPVTLLLQQSAAVLAQQLERFLFRLFPEENDAVSEKAFDAFFETGAVTPAEFRRLLGQLRNALKILAAEPADTAQAQKLGTRMTIERLSSRLAALLEEKQMHHGQSAEKVQDGAATEETTDQRDTSLPQTEEARLREELKQLEARAREALKASMTDESEAGTDLLPPEAAEGIYIRNAGLVFFWPFLNQFFSELGLAEDGAFIDEEAQVRAVHLLQYLATGVNEEVEEHELVLNKLLCGMPVTVELPLWVSLTDAEMAEGEELCEAVIRNWEALRRTSPGGLRGSFILREGRLSINEDEDWDLLVERVTIDLLIDSLPYSISPIRLPWMETSLHTEW